VFNRNTGFLRWPHDDPPIAGPTVRARLNIMALKRCLAQILASHHVHGEGLAAGTSMAVMIPSASASTMMR